MEKNEWRFDSFDLVGILDSPGGWKNIFYIFVVTTRELAKPGYRACFGNRRPLVQIQYSRP